jgi:hypothetical protein
VDTVAGRALVSDTAEYRGGNMPKLEGSFNNTFTLLRSLRLYSQLDGKFKFFVYDLNRDFADRSTRNTAAVLLPPGQGGYSRYEMIKRTGPYANERTGATVSNSLVRGSYIQPADFVRLREVSLTWTLPATLSKRFPLAGSSLTVGGRNLALWTKYEGVDPEVNGIELFSVPGSPTLNRGDVWTTPQVRRLFTRLNFQF